MQKKFLKDEQFGDIESEVEDISPEQPEESEEQELEKMESDIEDESDVKDKSIVDSTEILQETEKGLDEERGIEKQEFREQTVAEFLEELEGIRDETEDEKTKNLLTFQIAKIQLGLMAAELKLDEIKVGPLGKGVIGVFNTQNKEITISKELLLDFNTDSKLIELVGTHEGFHKGIYRYKPIADEGLTEEAAERKVGKRTEIYRAKRTAAKKIWEDEGFVEILKKYDIEAPKKLVKFYLHTGIEHELSSKIEAYKKEKAQNKKEQKLVNLEKEVEGLSKKLEKKFKRGAERLHDKLKEVEKDNFFKKTSKEIIKELIKQ